MKENAPPKTKLQEILSREITPYEELKSITLVAMFRKGANEDTIEIGLDETGIWVPLATNLIQSVEDAGQITFNGKTQKVLKVTFNRPEKDYAWYDLLAFTLQRASRLIPKTNSCNCGDSSSLPAGAVGRYRGNRPVHGGIAGTTASCLSCYIFTLASGEQFCYVYGHCD